MAESKVMIGQSYKRTAIHTRKEAISIFDELKNKINFAYESLNQESFEALLTIIKTIFYLSPMPRFLSQINGIASIPVTTFLENLLIKTHMTKLKLMNIFKNWVITLLLQFNKEIPKLKLDNIKEIKQKKFQLYNQWNSDVILSFVKTDLLIAVKRRDFGVVSVLVYFLRVYIIFQEHHKRFLISKQDQRWKLLIYNLVQGSKVLDNLKKQEIAVCICYYLCIKEKSLCLNAVQSGVIEYLVQLLKRPLISASFGKKVIEFLKYLMIHLDCRLLSQIDIPSFQHSLGLFSSKFHKDDIIITIRDLINIFQQKIAFIDYQEKIDALSDIYMQVNNQSVLPEKFFQIMSIINLYIHNQRMGNLLVKNYESLFAKILTQQKAPYLIKMICGFLAFNFKKGKFGPVVALQMIRKITQTVENASFRQILLQDRKKLLIDYVKILKMLLSNREHHQKVVQEVHIHHLEQKFWHFSDCTNYMYEKELIELQRMLDHKKTTELEEKQIDVLTKLQADIINKSRFNLNKLSWQLFQEVKFLQNLVNDSKSSKKFKPSPEIAVVVSNYIQTTNHKSTFALLQNIQNEQNQVLRKQFNLICTKLLTKLLKEDKNSIQMKQVKQKMISLTTSKDQIDDIYDMINSFFQKQQDASLQHQKKMVQMRLNSKSQPQFQPKNSFASEIKALLYKYFRTDEHFDLSLIKVNNEGDLHIVLNQLNLYQNESDILNYLKIVFELCKKENTCIQIYRLLSVKLLTIYQALISRQEGNDKEVVIFLDNIFLKFAKFHLKSLFSDEYDPDSIQFYFQIVSEIDSHFQFGFTNKRVELLQLIIEYFDCNMIQSHQEYEKLIKKEDRSQIIRTSIDSNNAQSLGLTYGKLIFLNSDDEVHQAFWMQHKQHIIRGLCDTRENISFLKFLQVYFTQCQRFIFKQYQLQNLIQIVIQLATKQVQNQQNLFQNTTSIVLKLRKFKYIGCVLQSFIQREDLKGNKNLLYSQQDLIIRILLHLLEFYQQMLTQQVQAFKKFYIQQIIVKMITIVTKLYKNNFIDKEIRGEYLVGHLDALMEINNQNVITKVCELMHIYLLKKLFAMIECKSLHTCKEYIQSLPVNAQAHIQACKRIEDALALDQSLEEEIKAYFLPTPQEEQQQISEFQNFAKNLYRTSVQSQNHKNQKIQVLGDLPNQNQVNAIKVKQEQNKANIQDQPKSWSYQILLQRLKSIIQDHNSASIKQIAQNLVDYQSLEYCKYLMQLFLQSQTLYQNDKSQIQLTLQQVNYAIINHIPCGCCPLDKKYYQILQKSGIGASICTRKNGGFKATQALCKKVTTIDNQSQFFRYLQALTKNLSSLNELKYINSIKLYECINSKVIKILADQNKLSLACKFVKQTTQLPAIRGNYEFSYHLALTLIESDYRENVKIDILQALAGLTSDCHKHKKIAESTKIVTYITSTLKQEQKNANLFLPCTQVLANIIDYSQTLITQIYHFLGIQQLALKIIGNQVSAGKNSPVITNCLKVLDFLSKNKQSSTKILRANYSHVLVPICSLSIQQNQSNQNIGFQINILLNIFKTHQSAVQTVLSSLILQNLIEFSVLASKVVPKIKKSQFFFEIIEIMAILPYVIQKFMEKNNILAVLCQILKQGQYQIGIVQKWMKIISMIFEIPKFLYASEILKSNIFFLAANCLKLNTFLTQNTMSISIRLMKSLNAIQDPQNLLIRHGFVDFMIQILKMKNLQAEDYISMLIVLKRLQDKSIFPPHLSTKIFQIVIKNLEHHWKDQIAINSIILLKKIKKNVQITGQFSHSIFQFFNKFLTNGCKINNIEYYSISRQVICLISYFINFNQEVKIMFRGKVVIDILKNWLKIFKNLAEEESSQTYRLWLYSVYNNQAFHYDICSISNIKLAQIESRFEKGWKCNLFRMDGSYKNALLKYKASLQQIQTFKQPEGQVKPKYRLPLKNILLTYRYNADKDLLFTQSRFKRTINPFQHQVNPLNSLTIFCLMQERFQVRQISVQMENRADLEQVYGYLKIILNKLFQEQKEEEIKLWKVKSSKQSPVK